ncbi:MAG TPA: right-handed parallel beta-helix repeat-containing protein [Thermoanaerobaculia bacterium]|nr:right-handed parallel beta-helix repeat-containing protein [Thermoanaerobaculia bacterium]
MNPLLGLVLAATYFVAPGGNDHHPGTKDRPFQTITHGVSVLKAGDELQVRGGVYRESVRVVDLHGTEGAPIRIRAYPGEKPVIDGKGTTANGLVIFSLSSWIRFDGFEVRNGPKSGVLLYDVQDIKVRGNDIHHHFRFGIHVVSDSDKPRGTSRNVVIESNKVHHNVQQNANGRARQWMQGIGTYRAASVDIIDNDVYENFGEGIDAVVSDDVTIARNTVWDNFSANIYLDNATNTRVDDNVIVAGWAKDPKRYYRLGHPAPSIFSANERYEEQNPLRDITVTNNLAIGGKYGFGYGDYQVGGGLHRAVIAHNTFYGTTDRVLYLESEKHDSTTIENNIFAGSVYAPDADVAYRGNCWWGGDERTYKRGAGDVFDDPKFVRAGGKDKRDFELHPGSPCAGKGWRSGLSAR